ncbi:hypothetical protein HT667_06860 [Ursidibacter maritimus]|uniref:hypothetical protein n=1 Tax=Ursidibacter maritimus TaxID=1331689 RepID=UPI001C440DAF|nr:hypothetical protein [Ursidibacter maritimus]MBV6541175.1 hypothetical protein [Ursidibacter maritimus]
MKNWLIKTYTEPQTNTHYIFYIINQKMIYFLVSIIITFTLLPALLYFNTYSDKLAHKIYQESLTQEIEQQAKLLDTLIQKSNQHKITDKISQVNQAIRQIFNTYNIQIEQLEWHIEERQIVINAKNESKNLIMIIPKLQEIPNITYQEISLSKLYHQNLVLLNATLQINN